MTRITQFEAENVKRLTAVKITPDGNVILGGANGAGKSSVLDAVMYAIAGKAAMPGEPLRQGEKSGHVTVTLDGENPLTITRYFGEGGTTRLVVADAAGNKFRGPQAILDRLFSDLTFDPVAFLRMKPAEQAEALRVAAGVDLTEADAAIERAYEARTECNRDVKLLEAQCQVGKMEDGDVPDALVDIKELAVERSRLQKEEDNVARAGQYCDAAARDVTGHARRVRDLETKLAEAKDAATEAQRDHKEAGKAVLACRAASDIDTDLMTVDAAIETATVANAAYQAAASHRALKEELAVAKETAGMADAVVTTARATKAEMLAAITMPVKGLALTDEGVQFNGLPLNQCSQAEGITVSTAIGLAANPELRVMMIRDGSLLDKEHLQLVCDAATEAECDFWIERVGEDEHTTVVIEDGAVRAPQTMEVE